MLLINHLRNYIMYDNWSALALTKSYSTGRFGEQVAWSARLVGYPAKMFVDKPDEDITVC